MQTRRLARLLLVGTLLAGCTEYVSGPNRPPVAAAGGDRQIDLGATVTLDGSRSFDPDGDTISYSWGLVAAPADGTADLTNDWGEATQLAPDAAGIWMVRLMVSDGSLDSEPDTVLVRVEGRTCESPDQCDDGNDCTQDTCPAGSCLNQPVTDGLACNDDLWCTVNDACTLGSCSGDERDCSAAAAECVIPVCNEIQEQCEGQPAADGESCEDALFCTVDEQCNAGVCGGGQPRDCSASGGGCVDGVCDEDQDACVGDPLAAGTPCADDNLYCTGTETCDGNGNCLSSGDPCPDTPCNTCQESPPGCHDPAGTACPDADFCNGAETCDGSGTCQPGADPCPGTSCDEGSDACVDCLTNAHCQQCQKCQTGTCVNQGANEDLKDECPQNDCSTGWCDGSGSCGRIAQSTPCEGSDLNYCTSTCDGAGTCDQSTPVDCSHLDDQCNQGVCDPADGHCDQVPIVEGPANPGSCSDLVDNDCDSRTDDDDPGCQEDWWDARWTKRRKLVFRNQDQNENLVNFQVLVVLEEPDFVPGDFEPNGEDIRFVDDDDTTPLEYEIENWRKGTTSAFIWVKVPQINASSNLDYIWMYYGRTGAPDEQDRKSVWTNGYAGVWHFAQDPGAVTGIEDSSPYEKHGTASGLASTDLTSAPIADGLNFNGISSHIRVPSSASDVLAITGNQVTIETWVRRIDPPTGSWMIIIGRQLGDAVLDSYVLATKWDRPSQLATVFAPQEPNYSPQGTITPGDWLYTVGVRDGSTVYHYVEGNRTVTGSVTGNMQMDDNDVLIGAQENDNTRNPDSFWKGDLDEVRISNVPRTQNWIAAQYKSMTNDFITFEAVETWP